MARAMHPRNRSGFRGVVWDKYKGLWRAMLRSGGKLRHLGYFDTPEEAARAYDAAALEARGEWAAVNFRPTRKQVQPVPAGKSSYEAGVREVVGQNAPACEARVSSLPDPLHLHRRNTPEVTMLPTLTVEHVVYGYLTVTDPHALQQVRDLGEQVTFTTLPGYAGPVHVVHVDVPSEEPHFLTFSPNAVTDYRDPGSLL